MDLGQFSVSLGVKDITKSQEFYVALGFEVVGGDLAQNWLILQNDTTKIGLFQGMFEGDVLTFNPGNVRAVLKNLQDQGRAEGIEIKDDSGPAHFTIQDPDGRTILFDQF